jgi:hypothetical protein
VSQKKSDDFNDDLDKKEKKEKKPKSSVFTPITDTFKGTVFEIKDSLHTATDKLSLTKPKPGKDSASQRLAESSAKKSKDNKSQIANQGNAGTYVSNGKPVKNSSDGNGLVSKTLGKLPFIGSKKSANEPDARVAHKNDSDGQLLDTADSRRQTADKLDKLDGPAL